MTLPARIQPGFMGRRLGPRSWLGDEHGRAPRVDREEAREIAHDHHGDPVIAIQEHLEVALVEDEQSRRRRHPRRGRAREGVDEGELTEGVAGAKRAQDVLALRRRLGDFHRTLDDDEERAARIPLLEDDLARLIGFLEEMRGQSGQMTARQPDEERRAREERRAASLLQVRHPCQPSRQVLAAWREL